MILGQIKNTKPLIIRPIEAHELSFLEEMLYEAIYVPEGSLKFDKNIIKTPELHQYISDFGVENDCCLVAEWNGDLIGAVWIRLFRGYGFVDAHTPELSIALQPTFRNNGIGNKLLHSILAELPLLGFDKVSLSVDKHNFAYIWYKKFGFEDFVTDNTSVIMVKHLINNLEIDS